MSLQDIFEQKIKLTDEHTITIYSLVIAFLIILATWVIVWGIKRIVRRQQQRKAIDTAKSHTVFQLFKYLLWVIAITLAFETLGFKITLLVAGSAALLVGIGLGLQEIFKDIVSGIFMLFEGNIKIGDIMQLEEIIGKVVEVGLRTTKIETRDNIIMIIPNSKFIDENVINWSHIQTMTRFNVEVGVAYGSDVQLVKRILLDCAKNTPKVSPYPKPFVRFNDFGNSSLDFQIFFWTEQSFYVENIKSDMRFAIDAAFRENGVRIPFPQRDVHLFHNK